MIHQCLVVVELNRGVHKLRCLNTGGVRTCNSCGWRGVWGGLRGFGVGLRGFEMGDEVWGSYKQHTTTGFWHPIIGGLEYIDGWGSFSLEDHAWIPHSKIYVGQNWPGSGYCRTWPSMGQCDPKFESKLSRIQFWNQILLKTTYRVCLARNREIPPFGIRVNSDPFQCILYVRCLSGCLFVCLFACLYYRWGMQ